MLLIRVSPDRILIISEYWVFVPVIVTGNVILAFIIKKIVVYYRQRKIKKLVKNIKSDKLFAWHVYQFLLIVETSRYAKAVRARKKRNAKKSLLKQIYRILFRVIFRNVITVLKLRGGKDGLARILDDKMIDMEFEKCFVEKGLQFLDNKQIVNHIFRNYKRKAQNGIIYITKQAICYVIKNHAILGIGTISTRDLLLEIPALIEMSNLFIAHQKFLAALLMLGPGTFTVSLIVFEVISVSSLPLAGSVLCALVGAVWTAKIADPEAIFVKTTAVLLEQIKSLDQIQPRRPDYDEVIVVNLAEEKIPTIRMSEQNGNWVCSLPDQQLSNPVCQAHVPSFTDQIPTDNSIDINYDEVVNMRDVSGFGDNVRFTDEFDVHPKPKNDVKMRTKGKMVNFKEKFPDPPSIPESEQWDATINTPNKQNKIRNENIRNEE